jgi:hypothetical protein
MRPIAVLVFNILGLLAIWGLLEEPTLAAWILIAVGFALPGGLAYEARRGRLDRSIATAAMWWSVPFILFLCCYLAIGSTWGTLGVGIGASLLAQLARTWQGRPAHPAHALSTPRTEDRTI